MAAEAAALAGCRLAIFSSDWAAAKCDRSLRHLAREGEGRPVRCKPVGGRTRGRDGSPSGATLPKNQCRLTLIGVDWHRKRAAFAVEVAVALNARGLATTLTIAGCQPPAGFKLPDCVTIHPFFSKRTPQGQATLARLLGSSHLLIGPSRAEAYGVVFAEASAYGVPSLATRVGGIPTVVRDGVNGRTFDLHAPATAWADTIMSILGDPVAYEALCRSSLTEYQQRLNWKTAGRQVLSLMAAARFA